MNGGARPVEPPPPLRGPPPPTGEEIQGRRFDLSQIVHKPTGAEIRRAALISLLATVGSLIGPTLALAQAVNINLGTGEGLTDRIVQLVGLITVLSLAPSIVIMTTSFVRIIVVLSLLRQALGLQQTPPNSVLISLSLFLTAIIMGPTLQASYAQGIKPLLDHKMELPAAFGAAAAPVKGFMLSQVDRDDLGLFLRLSRTPPPLHAMDTPLQVVTPAFMISELKRAFEIGFLLFVPFLVIDLVVASVLMSMGMMMLPPVVVSLPFKLIFFVLVDGWRLVAGSLVESFHHAAGAG
jgi:flagellar biosynthetic protein FliP